MGLNIAFFAQERFKISFRFARKWVQILTSKSFLDAAGQTYTTDKEKWAHFGRLWLVVTVIESAKKWHEGFWKSCKTLALIASVISVIILFTDANPTSWNALLLVPPALYLMARTTGLIGLGIFCWKLKMHERVTPPQADLDEVIKSLKTLTHRPLSSSASAEAGESSS